MSGKLVGCLLLPVVHILSVLLVLFGVCALELSNNDLTAATVVSNHGTVSGLMIDHVPHELVCGDDERIK